MAQKHASSDEKVGKTGERGENSAPHAVLWFPTVVLNLEVEMTLPKEGVEWLAVSVMSSQATCLDFEVNFSRPARISTDVSI